VRRAGPQVVLKVALGTTPVGADGGSPLSCHDGGPMGRAAAKRKRS